MATAPSPPILIWTPGGGVPVGPISNPPVYSQKGVTPLIQGQAYIDVVFGSIQTTSDWVLATCEVENTTDLNPLNIWPGIITNRTSAGFRVQLNGLPDSGNYYLHWAVSGVNITPSPASTYYLTGPSTGGLGVAATFTVALPPSTTVPGAITVTPSDGSGGGVFSPVSVTLTSSSASATFTYTPGSYGAKTISVTNSGTLINPVALTFTSLAATYTFTGPTSGGTGVPSTNFTVALPVGSAVIGAVTVTPNDSSGGGAFTPSTVNLTTGASSGTFTYTAASNGTKTISVTNNGGLTDPGNISYVASTPFAPTDIAGLKGWWKADALALADGANVTTWPDSGGGGFDLVSGAGGLFPPTFKTNILNGKPIVRFGSSLGLATSADTMPGNYTMFAVAKAASISAGSHQIFDFGVVTGPTVILRRDVDTLNFYHYDGSVFRNVAETSGIVANAWNYITANWDGANIHMWRNGTLKGTTAATTIGPTGAYLAIGYQVGVNDSFWDGDIAEVLIYNSALSSTDRGNVELFLKTKYAL